MGAGGFSNLPDVCFANNVGTISFLRTMIEVADEWHWDGRMAIITKRYNVEGYMTRAPAERVDLIDTNNQQLVGTRGTLMLPWLTAPLANIKLDSLENPHGTFDNTLVPVNASFTDDYPTNNTHELTWFGITLYNPRIRMPISVRQTSDDFVQIPANLTGTTVDYGTVAPTNPWYGPIRYVSKFGMMQIEVTGSFIPVNGVVDDTTIATFTQRVGYGGVTMAGMPNGYPNVFNLNTAIPQLSNDCNIVGCFVAGGGIDWDVEHKTARVQIQLLAQPQEWKNS